VEFQICGRCRRNRVRESLLVEGMEFILCTECISEIKAEIAKPPLESAGEPELVTA
jgi:hypothetical protein